MARGMKDSGIAWIGEIPDGWKIIRIKHCAWLKGRIGWQGLTAAEYVDDGPYLVTGTDFNCGFINWSTCVHISKERFDMDKDIQIIEGDLLITKDGTVGKVAIARGCPKEVSLNSGVLLIRNIGQYKYVDKYLYYVLLSDVFWNWYILNQTGQSTIKHLYQEQFYNFKFTFPTLDEQSRIAAYLDNHCAEIDHIMEQTRENIEEYKKLKQSIITEAVTHGVRGPRKMKDSGVKWIGEIPEEWEVTKFKRLGSCRNGLTYSPADQCGEEGTLVLRSSNIQNGKLSFDDCVYVNKEIPDELMVHPNDILICSRNGSAKLIGKNVIIPAGMTASFGAFMMIYRCKKPKYLQYVLSSNIFNYYLGTFLTVSVNQLTGSNFDNIIFPYTSDDSESEEIVQYLDIRCAKIDRLIDSKQQLLTELEAYKKSVIYEYVTGKREVPQ